MLTINGNSVQAAGQNLLAYLQEHNYNPQRVAVEHNGEIVPRRNYGEVFLEEGDVLEIVSFVGGG